MGDVDSVARTAVRLQSLLGASDPHRGTQAAALSSDLATTCLMNMLQSDLSFCASHVFHSEHGVLVFLRESMEIADFDSAKDKLLDFLTAFIPKIGSSALSYIVEIKSVCVSLFTREKAARVRNASFGPLLEVFKLCDSYTPETRSQLAVELGVSKLVEKYIDALVGGASKLVPTVKQNMLQLLGVLSRYFPLVIGGKDTIILNIYMSFLKGEMESQNAKSEMPIIAGCFDGLSNFLYHFTQSSDAGE